MLVRVGLVITGRVGGWVFTGTDALLGLIPGMRVLYQSWKQVAFSSEGDVGIFARVILVPDETGRMQMMGFSARRPIDGDPETICVFVPGSPNPTSGRLYFVPARDCVVLDLPARAAFKVLISGGNYVPEQIGRQLVARRRTSGGGGVGGDNSGTSHLGAGASSGHAGEP